MESINDIPDITEPANMKRLKGLYYFFGDIEYALEAYIQGYNASELALKGYPPYWIYLIWVKM